MKKILIFTGDQAYAPSKASATVNTGLDLEILASGAVGIYGLVQNDATTPANNNKFTLITNAASGANLVQATDFVTGGGDLFRIVQGVANLPVTSSADIQRKGVTRVVKQSYVAPVAGVWAIGFNGTDGSLNLPTITQNSYATLMAVQQIVTTNDQIREQIQWSTSPMSPSNTAYDVVNQLVNAINTSLTRTHIGEILTNGTKVVVAIGTQITGTGTPTYSATNGSTTLTITSTTLTATTIVSGDVLEINGAIYKVSGTPVVAANVLTLTLDKPYQGATVVDAAIATLKTVTAITEFGIKVTAVVPADVYNFAKQDLIENATLTLLTAPTPGLGTGAEVVKIEEGLIAYRGQFDTYSKWAVQLARYANAGTNYNLYSIYYRNTTTESGFDHNKGDNSAIQIAVPTTWTAAANFEAILKALATNAIFNF